MSSNGSAKCTLKAVPFRGSQSTRCEEPKIPNGGTQNPQKVHFIYRVPRRKIQLIQWYDFIFQNREKWGYRHTRFSSYGVIT